VKFEWDPEKERLNRIKHRVTFAEACHIFSDKNNLTVYDHAHSHGEDRWVTIGRSSRGILSVVVHTYHKAAGIETIRIISARRASRRETAQYYEREES